MTRLENVDGENSSYPITQSGRGKKKNTSLNIIKDIVHRMVFCGR